MAASIRLWRLSLTRYWQKAPRIRLGPFTAGVLSESLPSSLQSFSSQNPTSNRKWIHHSHQQQLHPFQGSYQREIHIDELILAVDELELAETLEPSDHESRIKPLLFACQSLMGVASQQVHNKPLAASLAERILLNCIARLPSDIHERHENAEHLIFPDLEDFNKVLLISALLRSTEGAQQAKRIFRLLETEHREEMRYMMMLSMTKAGLQQQQKPLMPAPDMTSFKHLCKAYALSVTLDGALEAQAILERVEAMGNESHTAPTTAAARLKFSSISLKQLPDLEFYNLCLGAFSKDRVDDPCLIDLARALFQRMTTLEHIQPDWFSYYALLKCYRQCYNAGRATPTMVMELESLLINLHRVEVPRDSVERLATESRYAHSIAYGVLVDFYLLSKTPTEQNIRKAHSLVLAMAGDSSQVTAFDKMTQDNWPEHQTIIAVYKAWEQSDLPDKNERIQELREIAEETVYNNVFSFNRNMERWAESGLNNVELILHQMVGRLQHPKSTFHPKPKTFGLVMKAWFQSARPEAPIQVEKLLQKLRQSRKYVANTFVVLAMKSWFRHCADGKRHRGLNGEFLAAYHVTCHLRDTRSWAKWNISLFQIAIQAWALQKPPEDEPFHCCEQALKLLQSMESRCHPSQMKAENHNSLLRCFLNVPVELINKKQRNTILSIVDLALEKKRQRNAQTFVLSLSVLKLFGHVEPKVAMRWFQKAQTENKVSQQLVWEVAGLLEEESLRALFLLSTTEAAEIINMRESLCRRNGENGGTVWAGFQAAEKLKLENLPQNWSLNVEQ